MHLCKHTHKTLDRTSSKACTPMLKRVTPSDMYACSRGASNVPGSASIDTSAPAAMPKLPSSALMMRASSGGGMSEGVPPPKKTVCSGWALSRACSRISVQRRSTYASNLSSAPAPRLVHALVQRAWAVPGFTNLTH